MEKINFDAAVAALGEVSQAGDEARQSVDALRDSLRAAAAQSVKAARSLAKFDEINRLAAPAAEKAADAAKTASGSGSKSNKATGGKSNSGSRGMTENLDGLLGLWGRFWAQVQSFLQPFADAWGQLWANAKTVAGEVWQAVASAATSASQQLLALLAPIGESVAGLWQTVTQGVLTGLQEAWAAYGPALMQGASEALANLGAVLTALWDGVIQPVLLELIAMLDGLWREHLQPLWDQAVQCAAAVSSLLLTLWNTVLAPLLQWLIAAFGPAVVAAFTAVADCVSGTVGIIAGCVTLLLTVLQGVADFVTLVLQGQWDAAWASMGDTVQAVWGRITAIVQTAASTVLAVVRGMISTAAALVNGLLGSLSRVHKIVHDGSSAVLPQAALPGLAFAQAVPIPALAAGAVIPPNRRFLAMLGDQTGGTNVEAPLSVIKQAMAETLAGWQGGGSGQPINVYIGEELLDTVIANSQERRALRSGGR